MWPAALDAEPVRRALAGSELLRQETVRLWGTLESQLAATLRAHADELTGLEITTCLRDGELEIVTRFGAGEQAAYDRLLAVLVEQHGDTLVSTGPTVDDLVAGALGDRRLTVATAESCTGGLLAGRLTGRPGSSAWVLGGVVAYSNSAKQALLGVPGDMIAELGAVSPEVATALAAGARTRFGADIGVGITGIAGPDGGTPDKPVGTVHICVAAADRSELRALRLPGSRAAVRDRSVTVGMQMLRQLLLGGPPA
jgi:nicotinamide-nucleotide amidase